VNVLGSDIFLAMDSVQFGLSVWV